MMSPTARSLALLRTEGFTVDIVERHIAAAGIRRDWGHFADLLAVRAKDRSFLLVQSSTRANVSARLAKSKLQPELAEWLAAGGLFEVHGWCLIGGRWRCKRVAIMPGDVTAVLETPPRKRPRSRWQPGDLFGGHPLEPLPPDVDPCRAEPPF